MRSPWSAKREIILMKLHKGYSAFAGLIQCIIDIDAVKETEKRLMNINMA